MFSITIALGTSTPTTWTMMFKTRQTADNVWHTIESEPTALSAFLEDDFGQRFIIRRENICGVLFEDLELSKVAHIERALHQARTQVKAKQMADADPVLRTASMSGAFGGSSPAIISPMRGNGPQR